MRTPLLALAICLALVAGGAGCGGDGATSSEGQGSDSTTTTAGGGDANRDERPLETEATEVVLGAYEAEGPFAAVSGRKGKKPVFEPYDRPISKKTFIRDLKVGSGPAAQRGDEVTLYYAGAETDTGKIRYYGWPPLRPGASPKLGFGTFGKSWEKSIEGMKVGGIRQVVITASYLSREPLQYVIVLMGLRQQ